MKLDLRQRAHYLPILVAGAAAAGFFGLGPALRSMQRPAPQPAPIAAAPPAQSKVQPKAEKCHGDKCPKMVELEVRDVIPLPDAQTHAVLLSTTDHDTVLPIFVDEGAAIAIALRLTHHASPLPLAQDLLDSLLTELGGTLTEVRIDGIDHSAFTGKVLITQGQKHMELEARPSDSIALALSHGVKIYASLEVMEEAGISRSDLGELEEKEPEAPGVGGSGSPDVSL